MTEPTLISARPQLTDPRGFLLAAMADLPLSMAIGWALFRANLRARQRRSALGYLWLLAPAAAATVICTYLQSRRIVEIGSTQLPYAAHVLAGMLLWQIFVEALNAPLQQLTISRQMMTRSRVPHEAIIIGGVFEVLLNGAIRLAVLAAAAAWFGVDFAPTILLVPLGAAALILLGLAFGMIILPWGLLYQDVGRAIALGTTLWFFLTPVFYRAPAGGLTRINPVTPLLDSTRSWIGPGGASAAFLPVTAGAAACLVLAWLFYRLARPHVVARLG
ncbi:ABC transporter permease [Sphingosinicella sp. BN140058]|uniref:ABC transporter permease n=1 Tax=Sphingosinicella sp. BN140058 TaxID=1892855 RepID=UPI0013EDF317|nr:ABC transporter permease [Sphingosinicella sp. BN140058]